MGQLPSRWPWALGVPVMGGLLGLWLVMGQMANAQAPRDAIDEMDLARLDKKLNQIIATQETILQRFDAVMEELRIIKIRSTR